MSMYTQSIMEILQAHKTSEQSLMSPSDVYDIALSCLFDSAPINVIDSEYREAFITGFTLHFFKEEIGLETLPLWKIALNEKLINNAQFINLIYSNLDKQIFSDYHISRTQGQGTSSGTKTGSTSNSKTTSGTTNVHTDDDNTHSSTDSISNTKTNVLDEDGTYRKTGTEQTVDENTQSSESSDSKTTDLNSVQINFDTPMGSLGNMRTPGGDAKGEGVSYVNSQSYDYMTSAAELDQSNVESGSQTQEVTDNGTSTITYNTSDSTTKDSTNTLTETGTNTGSTSDERDIDTRTTNSGLEEISGSTSDTESGSHTNSSETVDYSINWEVLLKTIPYLNKVWSIFDDLFMLIF